MFAATAPLAASDMTALRAELSFLVKNKSFWSEFTQKKTIKNLGVALTSKGRFEIIDKKQIVWQILEPSYLRVELQPGELRLIKDKERKNAQVLKQDQANESQNAWLDLLVFDEEKVATKFTVKKVSKKEFELSPKSKDAPFKKITCFTREGFFEKIILKENEEDQIEIHLAPPHKGLFPK